MNKEGNTEWAKRRKERMDYDIREPSLRPEDNLTHFRQRLFLDGSEWLWKRTGKWLAVCQQVFSLHNKPKNRSGRCGHGIITDNPEGTGMLDFFPET